MKRSYARPLVYGFVVLLALLVSQVALGDLVPRLIVDPKPAGLLVSLSITQSDSQVVQLTVQNRSTVLLMVDGSRSSFVTPDGQIHQLSTGVGKDFTNPLLPEESASGALGGLGVLQAGNQLKVRLVWTLGAVVGWATWVWQVEESSPTAEAPAPTPKPAPAPTPTTGSSTTTASTVTQPTTGETASSDYVIGLVAIVGGLMLLVLLGWGLWSLLS